MKLITPLLIFFFIVSCSPQDELKPPTNPYDPDNPDYEPPMALIISGPEDGSILNSSSVTFAWEGNISAFKYSWRLNNEEWSTRSITTNASYNNLDEGNYSFEVKAIGGNNVVQEIPTTIHFTVDAIQGPALMFSPRYLTLSIGDEISIDIIAEDVDSIMGVEVEIEYDPLKIRITDIDAGVFMTQNSGQLLFFSSIDTVNGIINIVSVTSNGTVPTISGSGIIATLTLKTISEGSTNLEYNDNCVYKDKDNNEIELNTKVGILIDIENSNQQYPTGLIAYYPFNGNTNDESGNGYHGINNSAILAKDRFGNENSAYQFNGADTYISLNSLSNLELNGNFTLAAWIKWSGSTEYYQRIITKWGAGTEYEGQFILSLNYDRHVGGIKDNSLILFLGSSDESKSVQSSFIPDDNWHLIVTTYDNETVKFYIDGDMNYSQSVTIDYISSEQSIYIGGGASSGEMPAYIFNGLIDDVSIYSQTLSVSEIDSLYHVDGWTPDDNPYYGIDHLIISEIVLQPSTSEYFTIYNPTDNSINMTDYYITDATDPTNNKYYYNLPTAANYQSTSSTDFTARFPSGRTINANSSLIVCIPTKASFTGSQVVTPDLSIKEDFLPAITGQSTIGSAPYYMDNTAETLVLFYWDGSSSTVKDVDYILWGNNTNGIDKSGISTYKNDTPVAQQKFTPVHVDGQKLKRIGSEGTELNTGGNGITGHNETSENLDETWEVVD